MMLAPMISPFRTLTNAELRFSIPATTAAVNAVGNVTLVPDRVITVAAYLKLKPNRAKNDRPEGIPILADAFEGWAVEPMVLPAEIRSLSRATATIGGISGTFTLDANILNAPYGRTGLGGTIEELSGTKISGWFVRQG